MKKLQKISRKLQRFIIKPLLLFVFLVLTNCSKDDTDYATINGKVERAINGDGIADQKVLVLTQKGNGAGWFAYTEELDRKEVVTDANGNFSVDLVSDVNAFVTVVHQGDENYSGSGTMTSFQINEFVIINSDKFIKFKVYVNNTNPINQNDFIHIDFFAGLTNVKRTQIENFGVENTYYPEEQLPGGGAIGASEETSWTGIDVNSIVNYSVPETAEEYKIHWNMRKNGIETEGFTNEIPYNINQINVYSFEY